MNVISEVSYQQVRLVVMGYSTGRPPRHSSNG